METVQAARSAWVAGGVALALALGFTGGALAAPEGTAPAAAPPAWPAHVKVVEAKLAASEFEKPSFQLALPQLRIFDREGRLLYDHTGFDAAHFAAEFRRTLAKTKGTGSAEPFAKELQRLTAPDGKPLGELPKTSLRIVEWWADWCVPCHSQAREMAKVLAEKPTQEVALIHVEASMPGRGRKMIKLDESKLTPEMLEKLQDPKVSPAEKKKIMDAAMEKPEETPPPPR